MRLALVLLFLGPAAAQTSNLYFEYAQIAGIGLPDNRLVIEDRRATWFHEPKVPVLENDVIGVFQTDVTVADMEELRQLTPSRSTPGIRPDMPAISVRLRAAGRDDAVALGPRDTEAAPLISVVQNIVKRVSAHPYRALRIGIADRDPRRVEIENAGTQPLTLQLNEQRLFLETKRDPLQWKRVPSPAWNRAVTIPGGGRQEIAIPVQTDDSADRRMFRAVFQAPQSDSAEEVGGTTTSRAITPGALRAAFPGSRH
jgi:hypothetical protein